MPERSKTEVGTYLLAAANAGRERAAGGGTPGTSDRWLGRLSAPHHLLHPRPWNDAARVPTDAFVGLRLYLEAFDVEEKRAGGAVTLTLLYEHRSGP